MKETGISFRFHPGNGDCSFDPREIGENVDPSSKSEAINATLRDSRGSS
jgi:hypothetical protein